MISINDILNQSDKKNKFKQKLVWTNGSQRTCWLPQCVAPISSVMFWIKNLKVMNNTKIKSFKYLGYSSVEEIRGELIGWYKFFTTGRYHFIKSLLKDY